MAKRAAWLLTVAVLSACGGGGDKDEIPPGTCRKASIPSTGPGDASSYFPAQVGWSWTYNQNGGGTVTVTVTGTQVVGSETASVFTATSTSNPTPSQELVAKRPAGVVVLADPAGDPVDQQLSPELILPFPVAVMPRTEEIRCASLDVGDVDHDGKPDYADVVEYLTVFSTTETADVAAGHFTNVANVLREAQMTLRASAAGTLTLNLAMQDWYAPGVGRVVSLRTVSTAGYSNSTTIALASWTVPAAPAQAAVAAPPAPAAEIQPAPAWPEAGGLRRALRAAALSYLSR